jgi:hypothetical protein
VAPPVCHPRDMIAPFDDRPCAGQLDQHIY